MNFDQPFTFWHCAYKDIDGTKSSKVTDRGGECVAFGTTPTVDVVEGGTTIGGEVASSKSRVEWTMLDGMAYGGGRATGEIKLFIGARGTMFVFPLL